MKTLLVLALLLCLLGALSTTTRSTASQASGDYQELARQDARSVGINPTLFVRQISLESGFNPKALSSSGAEGIAQLMPATARALGVDPWNPSQALTGAARLMARYIHDYGRDALALAAYNAGPGRVDRCLRFRDWFACLPAETRAYIRAILQS